MNKEKIKQITKENNKKIGAEGIKRIMEITEEIIRKMITAASRKADLQGRKIIKEEDLRE